MKIEIDLNNSLPLKGQLIAVNEYIRLNIKSTIKFNCFGEVIRDDKEEVAFSKIPILNLTKKNGGKRLETVYGNYHVSCRKTKGGMYKFKTWGAI